MAVVSNNDKSVSSLRKSGYPGMDVWPALGDLPAGTAGSGDCVLAVAKELLKGPIEKTALPALELIGRRFDADRAWTVSYNNNLSAFRDTNEWCRGGITTHNVDNLDIPSTALGEMHRLMRGGHPVVVHDVDAMPKSMRALQTKLQLQDTKSTVGVPMRFEGRLRGIMGLDMTRTRCRWGADEVQELSRLSDLLACASFGARVISGAGNVAAAETPEEFLYFQSLRGIVGAHIGDIVACAAERDSTRFFLTNGDQVLDARNLKWWENILPESHFMRVHRSVVLQLHAVQKLQRRSTGQWVAHIDGYDAPFTVSRTKVVVLRNRLGC
ncbi:GAF domain-containing DNA-binding protein [bacterium SCSIO 12827]|nr:GAF domain-containing DNA-binding protein [bacterium SCSIO 12827]